MNIAINIITTLLLMPWGGIVMMSPMMVAAGGFKDSRSSILTTMAILGYPVIIFAVLKFMGWQYFGTEANPWLIGAMTVVGGIFLIYNFPGMLLNLSNAIPNTGYFVGKSAVYLDGDKISKAEPGSFEILKADYQYAKDRANIFLRGKIVDGADPKTFTAVNNRKNQSAGVATPLYWKDALHVFYNGKKLDQADPETFLHSGFYGWDSSHVYYEAKKLGNTDPKKFRLLKEGIASDGSSIFVYGKQSNLTVDPESFEVVPYESSIYCRDKNHIFILLFHQPDPLAIVEGADPVTYQPLERSYAVDKSHVYYCGSHGHKQPAVGKLEGANPQTFTVGYDQATKSDARDGVRLYMQGKLVK